MRQQNAIARFAALGGLALGMAMLGGSAGLAQSDPVTLTMIGAWPPEVSPSADIGHKFREVVNDIGEGKVLIDYKGASDVIPTFDQPEALVRGVFDVWYGAPNYWAGIIPGGYITELSPFETPDNGPGSELYDYMVDMYAAHGVRYLGHSGGAVGSGAHYMYTQEKVGSIDDLKGMKIRVPPLTRFFVNAIGAESVTLPPPEIHLALDRGTVDGFTWPLYDGFTNFGWQEVSRYIIVHPMYRSGVGVNMNLDKWNSLPEDVQEILLEAVRQTQEWSRGWIVETQESELAKMKEAGMEEIAFPPEEVERWNSVSQAVLWDHFEGVMDPESFAKAEEFLERRSE